MFDPHKKDDLKRLQTDVRGSDKAMEVYRKKRVELIKNYVGTHFSDDGNDSRIPLNFLALATEVYLMHLAASNPSVLVSARSRSMRGAADKLAIYTNHKLERMDFASDLYLVAFDGLFELGCLKIGETDGEDVPIDGIMHRAGEIFIDRVDLDDLILDMGARDIRYGRYRGNRYRIPLEVAQNSEYFDKKAREMLAPSDRRHMSEHGTDLVESIGGGDELDHNEFEDMVDLIDLYLPAHKLLLTFPDTTASWERPLAVVDWEGPDFGPYRFLNFYPIPNNTMPLSPMGLLRDLHELANELFVKVANQARRQKTVYFVRNGNEKDGKNVKESNDGDVFHCDDPNSVKEVVYGGAHGPTMAFIAQLQPLISYLGGSLDVVGGLSAQSGTFGQDQLLSQAASKRMARLQGVMQKFVKDVVTDFSYYAYNDPIAEAQLVKTIGRTGTLRIPFTYTPEDREQYEFFEFEFDIEPFSLMRLSPTQRLALLQQTFSTLIAPSLPLLAQSGMTLNFEEFLHLIGKYGGIAEELDRILIHTTGRTEDDIGKIERMPKSPVSRREYVRTNRPGANREQQANALMNVMLNNNIQPNETASLFRQAS